MEYIESNYTPIAVVAIGFAAKKLMKKDLVPVSGWKQMLTTYITVLSASILGGTIKKEIDKRSVTPKPN